MSLVNQNVPNNDLTVNSATIYGKNPINWLQEVCVKESLPKPYFSTNVVPESAPPMFETTCQVEMNQRLFTVSEAAKSKKESKTRCAAKMLIEMQFTACDLQKLHDISSSQSQWHARQQAQQMSASLEGDNAKNSNVTDETRRKDYDLQGVVGAAAVEPSNLVETLSSQFNSLLAKPIEAEASELSLSKSISQTNADNIDYKKNYPAQLIEFCAVNNLQSPIFEDIAKEGLAHALIFTMSCKVNDTIIVRSLQASKKKLKNYLSFLMLEKLCGSTEKSVSSLGCSENVCSKLFSHEHHVFLNKMCSSKIAELKVLEENGAITPENSVDLITQLCVHHCSLGLEMKAVYLHFRMENENNGIIYFPTEDVKRGSFCEITFMGHICSGFASGTDEAETKNLAAKAALLNLIGLSFDLPCDSGADTDM